MDGVSNQSLKSLTELGKKRIDGLVFYVYVCKGVYKNIKNREITKVKFISGGVGLRC